MKKNNIKEMKRSIKITFIIVSYLAVLNLGIFVAILALHNEGMLCT